MQAPAATERPSLRSCLQCRSKNLPKLEDLRSRLETERVAALSAKCTVVRGQHERLERAYAKIVRVLERELLQKNRGKGDRTP